MSDIQREVLQDGNFLKEVSVAILCGIALTWNLPANALEPIPPTSGVTPADCFGSASFNAPWRSSLLGNCFKTPEDALRWYCIDFRRRLPSVITPGAPREMAVWCYNDIQTVPQTFAMNIVNQLLFDTGKSAGGSNCVTLRSNPCNAGTGNKYQKETDYVDSGRGGLRLDRHYNSFGAYAGSFGPNWRGTFDRRVAPESNLGPLAFVSRTDGQSVPFDKVGANWVGRADNTGKLVQLAAGWQFTTPEDEIEEFDAKGRLLKITTKEGLVSTLAYTDGTAGAPNGGVYEGTSVTMAAGLLLRVTDHFGKTMSFGYNSSGRVARMTDPAGNNHLYAYGTPGNVTSVTYPSTGIGTPIRTYHYENGSYPLALTGITDENGVRFSTYSYSAQGRVASSEHAGGTEKVTFVFNANGTTTITDHVGTPGSPTTTPRTYSFQNTVEVLKSGAIAEAASCAGCGDTRSRTYDANGNVATSTDWNGNRTNYGYDLARNLETQRVEGLTSAGATTPQTRTINTQWHANFRLPVKAAEPLRITSYVYNGDVVSGSPVTCGLKADGVTPVPGVLCSRSVQATTDANGSTGFVATPTGTPRTWGYTYNAHGQVLTMDGPRIDVTDVTTYTYYANNDADLGKRGNVATIANALGQLTSITSYNAHGQPLTVVDPNGLTTTLTYDARRRLTSRTVGGETTTYTYDNAGQMTRVTLPDSSYLDYTYDAAHRLTQMTDNLGNKIVYTLDLMGNRTLEEVRDPGNVLAQTRSRVYSNLNRLSQEIGASSQTTAYAYDNQGNLTSIDGPLAGTGDTTVNQYDALNRLKQVTAPNSTVTQYAYNGLDQLTLVTDPRSLATGYSVDGLGNLTQQASPDTGTTANTYDAAGNLLTQTDAKSQVTTYAYDALNRVTSITFHDGAKQLYAYDQGTNGIGRLTQIQELNPGLAVTSQIAYGYDQKGRVTTETRTVNAVAYVTAYGYDSSGRMNAVTYPSGRTLAYSFDALGRVSQVNTTSPPSQGSQTQVVAQNIQYHPFGGVKGYTLGNGQLVAKTFDLDGRIAGYSLGASSYTLTFDNASRITGITEAGNPGNANTYNYDLLDRLTQAILPSNTLGYGYDAVGNRTTKSVGVNTDTYAYSPTSNRLATITPATGPTKSYTFDANGSTTDDSAKQFAYDTRGRMTSATTTVGTTNYQVNALGQRIRKTGTADTIFVYDTKGRLISEADPGGQVKREYLYLGDIPLAVIQ